MRIQYIIPGPMAAAERDRREALLRGWASESVEVEVVDVPSGPHGIETVADSYLAIPGLIDAAQRAEAFGIDGIIVGCGDDPGVEAVRELAPSITVTGPASAGIAVAMAYGDQFGILSVPEPTAIKRLLRRDGLNERCVGVELIELRPQEVMNHQEAVLDRMIVAARALEQRGADTIVLTCMSLTFLPELARVQDAVDAVVINTAQTALAMTELHVRLRLPPNRLAYPARAE
jgi:allantoin racemase